MIVRKTGQEIARMRRAGRIAASVMKSLSEMVRTGISTGQLDALAERLIRSYEAVPAFKGYRGYPANLCVSINDEVVHGIPGERRLEEGDIVGLDIGVVFRGYYADMARTLPVGKVDSAAAQLIKAAEEALHAAVGMARAGMRLHDISHAIESAAQRYGFTVVRDFVGHGIGRALHEEPQIPNFGGPHTGPLLKEGMTFAIESMVNRGSHEVKVLSDGWTAVSVDGGLSAHCEDTVLITHDEPEILTCLRRKKQ